jgi:hypothetical protein
VASGRRPGPRVLGGAGSGIDVIITVRAGGRAAGGAA